MQANNNSSKKGLFITFEGVDGCGKTTQIELLDKYLKEKNYETIVTLEPGGSDIGKLLREILLHHEGYVSDICETFLYLADRAQHIETVVLNNVNKGKIVLCDRHIDSTTAYQGYARGCDIEKINMLNDFATNGYKPDLTFLFDIDIKEASKRVGNNKDRLEKESLNFHQKVREGYLDLAKKFPQRIKVIDSSLTVDEVFNQVKKTIDGIL